jgi:hypothetical protein
MNNQPFRLCDIALVNGNRAIDSAGFRASTRRLPGQFQRRCGPASSAAESTATPVVSDRTHGSKTAQQNPVACS